MLGTGSCRCDTIATFAEKRRSVLRSVPVLLKTYMKRQFKWLAAGTTAIAALLLFPFLHVLLVVGNLAVHLVVLGLQLAPSRLPSARPPRRLIEREPFVSVQVPA